MKYGWNPQTIRVKGKMWRVEWSPRGYWSASHKDTKTVFSSDVAPGTCGTYPDLLVEIAFEKLIKKLKE